MSQDIDRLYREGVAGIRAGDKVKSRALLSEVVRLDPTHEQAWLWLSAVVENDEDRITCLQNVLTINPNSEAARRGLKKLGASTEIDTDMAGEPEDLPDPIHAYQEPSRPMEHSAAPAVDSLLESTNKPVRVTLTGKRSAPVETLPARRNSLVIGGVVLIIIGISLIAIVMFALYTIR